VAPVHLLRNKLVPRHQQHRAVVDESLEPVVSGELADDPLHREDRGEGEQPGSEGGQVAEDGSPDDGAEDDDHQQVEAGELGEHPLPEQSAEDDEGRVQEHGGDHHGHSRQRRHPKVVPEIVHVGDPAPSRIRLGPRGDGSVVHRR